jgi:hypothetical protein
LRALLRLALLGQTVTAERLGLVVVVVDQHLQRQRLGLVVAQVVRMAVEAAAAGLVALAAVLVRAALVALAVMALFISILGDAMKYRKLDSDGDMSFGIGLADFWIDVPDAVAQAVKTRLMLWQGEWFYNLAEGTAWIDGVIGHGTDVSADAVIYDRILNTQGCSEIVPDTYNSQLDRDARHLTVACEIDTIYGATTVNT